MVSVKGESLGGMEKTRTTDRLRVRRGTPFIGHGFHQKGQTQEQRLFLKLRKEKHGEIFLSSENEENTQK